MDRNLPIPMGAGANQGASSATPNVRSPGWNLPTAADPDNGLRPHELPQVVAMVASALALVRPVGMGDAAADDWIALAANELRDIPADLLDEAAVHVRRTCTHHGQIVPAVFGHVQDRWDERKRLRFGHIERGPRRNADPAPPEWWQPGADELEAVKRGIADKLRSGGDGR